VVAATVVGLGDVLDAEDVGPDLERLLHVLAAVAQKVQVRCRRRRFEILLELEHAGTFGVRVVDDVNLEERLL